MSRGGSSGGGAGAVTSVFTRIGAVVAAAGDYLASQVTNAADKAAAGQQAFTGEVAAPDFTPSGLTGSVAASRYVGATAAGAPVAGAHLVGDWCVDQTGKRFTCTVAGTPGTWVQEPGASSGGALIKANTDADVSFANSVATNTVADLIVPGTVAVGDRLHFVVMGEVNNNSGGTVTYTFALVLGATTILTSVAAGIATQAANRAFLIDVWVDVVAPATTQRVSAELRVSGNGSQWQVLTDQINMVGYGTAAENLTGGTTHAQAKCTMGTANAAASVTAHAAHLELIPKG